MARSWLVLLVAPRPSPVTEDLTVALGLRWLLRCLVCNFCVSVEKELLARSSGLWLWDGMFKCRAFGVSPQ